MKRISYTSLLSLTAAAVLTGCASAGGAAPAIQSDNGPTGLLKNGELSICMDPTYPPMEYYKDGAGGQPVGFDSDSAAALAEHWGVTPKFSVVSFDGLMPAMKAGRCDVVWSGMYISEEREQVADAVPYLATGRGIVTTVSNEGLTTLDDLAGKTIAVLSGSTNEAALKKLSAEFEADGRSSITIQSYPQNNQTTAAVRNGKADALIETDVSVAEIVRQSAGALKGDTSLFEVEDEFAVYTPKGSPMTAAVTDGLKALAEKGTLDDIAKHYGLDPERITAEGK